MQRYDLGAANEIKSKVVYRVEEIMPWLFTVIPVALSVRV